MGRLTLTLLSTQINLEGIIADLVPVRCPVLSVIVFVEEHSLLIAQVAQPLIQPSALGNWLLARLFFCFLVRRATDTGMVMCFRDGKNVCGEMGGDLGEEPRSKLVAVEDDPVRVPVVGREDFAPAADVDPCGLPRAGGDGRRVEGANVVWCEEVVDDDAGALGELWEAVLGKVDLEDAQGAVWRWRRESGDFRGGLEGAEKVHLKDGWGWIVEWVEWMWMWMVNVRVRAQIAAAGTNDSDSEINRK